VAEQQTEAKLDSVRGSSPLFKMANLMMSSSTNDSIRDMGNTVASQPALDTFINGSNPPTIVGDKA
jgi:hypothetical protein